MPIFIHKKFSDSRRGFVPPLIIQTALCVCCQRLSLLLPHLIYGQHSQHPAGHEQQRNPQHQIAAIAGFRGTGIAICHSGDLYRSFFVAADLAFFMLFACNAYPGLFGDNPDKCMLRLVRSVAAGSASMPVA